MELNTKGRYAVMAMTYLAKFGADAALPLSVVAEGQHLSLAYLEQLFVRLRRAGLVESARGRSGGYRLARQPEAINVAEIMAAVEQPVRMTRCEGLDGGGCLGDQRCLTHELWEALGEHINTFLTHVTLAEVAAGMPGRDREAGAEDWLRRFGMAAE